MPRTVRTVAAHTKGDPVNVTPVVVPDTIIGSIRDRLLTLPPQTRELTGHGDDTTIGDEAPHIQEARPRAVTATSEGR